MSLKHCISLNVFSFLGCYWVLAFYKFRCPECTRLHPRVIKFSKFPSAAKCERGFSEMNHFKYNLRTTLGQNTLSDFMRMNSLDQTIQWKPTDWTLLSVTGFLEQRQRDTFSRYSKLTTDILKLSANLLMMFIPGTSFKLAVQTWNWNNLFPIAHCSTAL